MELKRIHLNNAQSNVKHVGPGGLAIYRRTNSSEISPSVFPLTRGEPLRFSGRFLLCVNPPRWRMCCHT